MYKLPNEKPVAFELAIFKWIFIPLITLGLCTGIFKFQKKLNKCEKICEEKGFASFRYLAGKKYDAQSESCYCYTEEASNIKNKIPKGTQAF